ANRAELALRLQGRVTAHDRLDGEPGPSAGAVAETVHRHRELREILREGRRRRAVQKADEAVLDADLLEVEADRVEQILGPLAAGGSGPSRRSSTRRDEQPLHVERAVGLADDLGPGTPEAGPADAGVARPVDIDTDQIHALDAECGAVRALDADLDALGPAAPLRGEPQLTVRPRHAGAAVSAEATAEPRRARDIRLIGTDRGTTHDAGEIRLQRLWSHRSRDLEGAAAR